MRANDESVGDADEASGNDALFGRFGKEPEAWGGGEVLALLAFLLLIAFANSRLAIEPAVKENNIRRAIQNSFVLRWSGSRAEETSR